MNLAATMERAFCAYGDGEWAAAERLCLEAVRTDAGHVDALNLLGIMAAQSARPQQAVGFLQRVVAQAPGHAAAHYNLGNVLRELQQWGDARLSFQRATEANPTFAEAWNALGLSLQHSDELERSLASYERAITLRADFCEAHYNRAYLLNLLERSEDAIAAYDRVIALNADHAEAYNNRGVTCKRLGRWQDALADYDAAIRIRADYAEAWNNRGNALHELRRWREALTSFERALALRADYADAEGNRGTTLHELGEWEEALASYAGALALRPADPLVLVNRGTTLQALRRHDEAIASYREALAIDPGYADAHWNLALYRLLHGNYAQGWAGYEWRLKRREKRSAQTTPPRHYTGPRWRGDTALQGRTILLHCEQGYGDAIQFCRYVRQVSDLGAHIILEAPRALLALLRSLEGSTQRGQGVQGVQWVESGTALPPYDCHCPLMSLPLAFKTEINTIPAPRRYLQSNPATLNAWRERLGIASGLHIGLVWSGSMHHQNDHQRSIALAELLAGLPAGFQYVSLQKELHAADVATLHAHPELLHFGDALADFADTAALCDLMDVVISVDTSVAHLAGALGRPVWVLLAEPPEWRWLLERQDSPWYPSARLFRQPQRGDWQGVLAEVSAALLSLPSMPVRSELPAP